MDECVNYPQVFILTARNPYSDFELMKEKIAWYLNNHGYEKVDRSIFKRIIPGVNGFTPIKLYDEALDFFNASDITIIDDLLVAEVESNTKIHDFQESMLEIINLVKSKPEAYCDTVFFMSKITDEYDKSLIQETREAVNSLNDAISNSGCTLSKDQKKPNKTRIVEFEIACDTDCSNSDDELINEYAALMDPSNVDKLTGKPNTSILHMMALLEYPSETLQKELRDNLEGIQVVIIDDSRTDYRNFSALIEQLNKINCEGKCYPSIHWLSDVYNMVYQHRVKAIPDPEYILNRTTDEEKPVTDEEPKTPYKVYISMKTKGMPEEEIESEMNYIMKYEIPRLIDSSKKPVLARSVLHKDGLDHTPAELLADSLRVMAQCDGIYLTSNWFLDRKCTIEYAVAKEYGIHIMKGA